MSKRDIIAIGLFLLLIGFQYIHEFSISFRNYLSDKGVNSSIKSGKEVINYFSGIDVEAKAAIVWDAKENRVLFAKNEHSQLPLASLTKIMTALIALDAGEGIVVISKEDVMEEGDSGLLVGEEWDMPDLAKLTLVSSANDGAKSMASAITSLENVDGGTKTFVDVMNERAKTLGLSQTYFLNETGLDLSPNTSGGYGSVEDLVKLFYHTVTKYPDVFEATGKKQMTITSFSGKKHTVKNTNLEVEKVPGIVASKTGYTAIAGGNLVLLVNAGLNHPLVVGILGSSSNGRFTDAEKLVEAGITAASN